MASERAEQHHGLDEAARQVGVEVVGRADAAETGGRGRTELGFGHGALRRAAARAAASESRVLSRRGPRARPAEDPRRRSA
jgi:hypothetical protein